MTAKFLAWTCLVVGVVVIGIGGYGLWYQTVSNDAACGSAGVNAWRYASRDLSACAGEADRIAQAALALAIIELVLGIFLLGAGAYGLGAFSGSLFGRRGCSDFENFLAAEEEPATNRGELVFSANLDPCAHLFP